MVTKNLTRRSIHANQSKKNIHYPEFPNVSTNLKTPQIPPRSATGHEGNETIISTVRVTLLVLIGVGMCAFLFYPDIIRLASILQQNQDNVLKTTVQDNLSEETRTSTDENDDFIGDLMEGEEFDNDLEIDDEDSELKLEEEILLETNNKPVEETPKEVIQEKVQVKPDPGYSSAKSEHQNSEKVLRFSDGSDDKPRVLEFNIDDMVQDEPPYMKKEAVTKRSSAKTENHKSEKVLRFSDGSDDKPRVLEFNIDDMVQEEPPTVKKEAVKKRSINEKQKKGKRVEKKNIEPKEDVALPKEIRDYIPKFLNAVKAKKIFVDGRRLPPVELLPQKENNSSVKVFLFDEFLSPEECDGLVRAHDKHVKESSKLDPILCFDSISTLRSHLKEAKRKMKVTPNIFTKGTRCVNATFSRQLSDWLHRNWSHSTAFYPGESKFSTIFSNRVKAAMGLDQDNGGKFQLTSYSKEKAYKSHTDCIVDGKDKRDRVATVLVYLKDVEDGGETKFPELGIWVKPRKGRAVVWNNMDVDGKCESKSIHTANKVLQGKKYILLRWYYYKSFYSLGKRPPDPQLPVREPGTPRVSCDEFEHGSCRWYDEWNYEHMLDYEKQKLTLI